MSNKYYWHSRISERKFRRIISLFVAGRNAVETAKETNLDRKSVSDIYLRIRRRVLETSVKNKSYSFLESFETREPYFIAKTEIECKKYSGLYICGVLVVVYESGKYRSEIVYAESDEAFNELEKKILQNPEHLRDINLFGVVRKPLGIYYRDDFRPEYKSIKGYSSDFLVYFSHFRRNFRGVSWDKFILYIAEIEWRLNAFARNSKSGYKSVDEYYSATVKDKYNDLLEILRGDPL